VELDAVYHVHAAVSMCDVCSYLFHYVADDGVIYLCVTDDVSCFTCIWNLSFLAVYC